MTKPPEAPKHLETARGQSQESPLPPLNTDGPQRDVSPTDDAAQDEHLLESDAGLEISDNSLPSIDSLDADSDLSGFLSPHIGEDLKRSALRKLFHLPKFNRRDGLDDYDDDVKTFQPLGSILTSDMRYHLKRLASRATGFGQTKPPHANTPPTAAEERSAGLDLKKKPAAPESLRTVPEACPTALRPLPDMQIAAGGPCYRPALCAHGARSLSGCTRCLSACPTGAITSAGAVIRIDPEACRQEGLCAAVCPTGALKFSKPVTAGFLAGAHAALVKAVEAGVENPTVILHDADFAPDTLKILSEILPKESLWFPLDPVEALGMEIWLASLSCGASHVVVLAADGISPAVFELLQTQLSYAAAILEGMGLEKERLHLIRVESAEQAGLPIDIVQLAAVRAIRPSRLAPAEVKRTLLFESVDHLWQQSPALRPRAALPEGAPFGDVLIDPGACTLCLACVAVCPAQALCDGGEIPQIRFREDRCLQCGLCREVCPESAIQLAPRMVFDRKTRNCLRILNQASAICCVDCGKPFATQAMVDKMVQALSGHWMYQDDAAKRRLRMCRECRVRNFFQTNVR